MDGEKSHDLFCQNTFKKLSVMMQEPRDLSWSPTMEARLRNYVEGDNPDEFAIRMVERRQLLCALEVSSPAGGFNREYSDPALKKFFNPYISLKYNPLRTYETGSNGENITVTFIVLERRTPSQP